MTNLTPTKVEDIILKLNEFLADLRNTDKDEVMAKVEHLEKYIKDYFSEERDVLDLKKMTVELVDEMYIQISEMMLVDVHTRGYFGVITNRLFWELSQKGVLCFFILDNRLRDDRFKMTTELFRSSGFDVIYPYASGELEYSENYTPLNTRSYKEIEKEIDESRKQKRHILYVEKDESVNYLKDILHLAEEFQSEYVCVFRNKAPDEHKTATWLLGSFGDYLG